MLFCFPSRTKWTFQNDRYSCKLQIKLHLLAVLHNVTPQKLNKVLTFWINGTRCVFIKTGWNKTSSLQVKAKSRTKAASISLTSLSSWERTKRRYFWRVRPEKATVNLRASQSLCKYNLLYMLCFWRAAEHSCNVRLITIALFKQEIWNPFHRNSKRIAERKFLSGAVILRTKPYTRFLRV